MIVLYLWLLMVLLALALYWRMVAVLSVVVVAVNVTPHTKVAKR